MAPPDRQLRERDGERARFIHLRPMILSMECGFRRRVAAGLEVSPVGVLRQRRLSRFSGGSHSHPARSSDAAGAPSARSRSAAARRRTAALPARPPAADSANLPTDCARACTPCARRAQSRPSPPTASEIEFWSAGRCRGRPAAAVAAANVVDGRHGAVCARATSRMAQRRDATQLLPSTRGHRPHGACRPPCCERCSYTWA